ncbi:tetratricopeptide repeat protein [Desulfolutivibrio sulfoxidireducens]|uniref:tetratricopeptide repeat protein n=1 Tax=Desulfolutivibrio sulfoxidireducens TaxID=2773299 RepID=UPI001FE7CC1D|nr:tetratricopeptide repeat protein [Desulfolutivibrio sulfoxidireducens]
MMRPVITRFPAGLLRLLALAVLLAALPRFAWAVTYSFSTKADMDTLTVGFPASGGHPTVTRTGQREITLVFPPGSPSPDAPSENLDFSQSRFIAGVRPSTHGLVVSLRTDAVGFVGWPAGDGAVKIQIYRDPLGANWRPDSPAARSGTPSAAAPSVSGPSAPPVSSGVKAPVEIPQAKGEKRPAALPSLGENIPPAGGESGHALPALPPALGGQGGEAPKATAPVAADALSREPFFAVPHSLRSAVEHAGPDAARVLRPEGAVTIPSSLPPAASDPGGASRPLSDQAVPPPPGPVTGASGGPSGLPPLPPGLEGPEGAVKAAVTPPGPPIAPVPVAPVFSGPQAVRSGVSRKTERAEAPVADSHSADVVAPPPRASVPATVEPPAGQDLAQTPQAQSPEAAPEEGPGKDGQPAEMSQAESDNDGMLMSAQSKRLLGENEEALTMLEVLKARPDLTTEQREETLYTLAETLYDINKGDPSAHFDTIQAAYQEALNFNAKSKRIPAALLILGMLNLKAGNLPEANAYFNILRKRYPNDENIPLIHFYWGEHHFEKGDYQKAAQEYQELIQRYPESRFVREASMGMAKALVKLGRFQEAWQIADYIEKRWPRYYTEYPPLLRINGEIAYRLGDYKKAKDYYLTAYNIDPNAEGTDLVLARLGDIASRLHRARESVEFYELAVSRFPETEGGLIAKMRLAEKGVYDNPSIGEMFSAFEKPLQGGPEAIYTQIARDHPQSPLASLAQLKLAMWYLFKENYLQALEAATTFEKTFPNSPLAPRAGEVAAAAFEKMAESLLKTQQYARIAEVWREHPLLEKYRSIISDKGQLAAALSLLRTGHPRDSLRLALPFIGPAQSEAGVNALLLALHIYVEGDAWREILELADKVRGWRFTLDQRQRVEFAAALALENLGDTAKSRPLWARLAADFSLPPARRAVAMYYQAKESKAKNDPEKTLVFAQEAVTLFRETKTGPEKVADALNMLIEAGKNLGLYPAALKWAEEYAAMLPENGPDFAANRFRMAAIYREMGDTAKWRQTLERMRDAMPDTLYGKMAASELSARALEERANALTRVN